MKSMRSGKGLWFGSALIGASVAFSISMIPAHGQEQTTPLNSSGGLLNTELPLPDNYLMQTMKPVMLRLNGHVSVNRPAPVPPQTTALKPKPEAAPRMIPAGQQTQDKPAVAAQAAVATTPPPLAAEPSKPNNQISHDDPFNRQLDELIENAQKQDSNLQKYVAAVDKYADWKFRLGERTRDMLNYSCLFKGVSPSSEAGDVILDEKNKLKSLAAAKYMKQKLQDEIQMHAVSAVLQLAMGLGNQDACEGQKQAVEAANDLERLAGRTQAELVVNYLKSLQQANNQPLPQLSKPLWTIAESKARIDQAVASAAGNDPVVNEIKDDIHHYNAHSKGSLAAHRVARTALSVASMTPNFVGPAAQVVLFSYLTISGGTEQEKILKELYIDKRLNSRADLLNEQAHMALYNFQVGALTGNRLLLTCSQRLLSRLAGADTASKLVSSASIGLPLDQLGGTRPQ